VENEKNLWSELYGEEITDDEIKEIEANLVSFMKILLREQRRRENEKQS